MDSEYFNKKYAAIIAALGMLVIATPLVLMHSNSSQSNIKSSKNKDQQKKRVKLSETRYAPYTYKISDKSVDREEKKALAGFKVSRTQKSNYTVVKLDAKRQEYKDQTYKLKEGEQLYFIETSMGDDSNGHEYEMEDDTAVVVDANGYIVRN